MTHWLEKTHWYDTTVTYTQRGEEKTETALLWSDLVQTPDEARQAVMKLAAHNAQIVNPQIVSLNEIALADLDNYPDRDTRCLDDVMQQLPGYNTVGSKA